MELIQNLKWRYATKKFDPTQKISETDLEKIKEAISLSASSYGLQPYTVLIIENSELRKQLQPVSWGQSQIVDASYLVVFCNHTKVGAETIDSYLKLKADTQNLNIEDLEGYGDFMKSKIGELNDDAIKNWTARQTYIGLGNLLAACAELKIDACPMEGFEPDEYDTILGLSEKGLSASVIATIGYRSDEDITKDSKKVRKPISELFQVL
ncbi:NAD(P)H-dependent oxidoreductase [Aquimarina algiphila]|uniref:NAD(P)H-dependent oxidoreductase n=1 Tax=Aquimarina algiphila TaxID=2047982 RepID=A0A554VQ78_9FLAO|nr:NAD(P)H-dependent oxidoreductase [Aquimarina algiphila]TSE10691.1 NAD(P)H-dependent oxidoreductase [Aquimarina algiphila]